MSEYEFDPAIILNTKAWLRDEEIDYFANLLHEKLNYEFIRCWALQHADLTVQIPDKKKHIQILHSAAQKISEKGAFNMKGGHWTCSYFDGHLIHIYDSLNRPILNDQIKEKLQMLFGNRFDEENILIHRVQEQTNGSDCGRFAIANAVTLALGGNPEITTYKPYDVKKMPKHLLNIFEQREILPFPRTSASGLTIKTTKHKVITDEKKLVLPSVVSNIKTEKRKYPISADLLINTEECNISQKKNCKQEIVSISEECKGRIERNQRLNGDDMLFFGKILSNCSDYEPQDTLYIQNLDKIQAIPIYKKHLQILHSRGASGPSTDHWVCSYYDCKNVYIYDSLNTRTLHIDHQMYLQRLYPFLSIQENNVRFPIVQQQQTAHDCGYFAIAFSVSLLFRHKPGNIFYDCDNMRKHLLSMLETQTITPFPMEKHIDAPPLLSLAEINRREQKAYAERRRAAKKNIANNVCLPMDNEKSVIENNKSLSTTNGESKFENLKRKNKTASTGIKKQKVTKQHKTSKTEIPQDDNTYIPFKSSSEEYIQHLTNEILIECVDDIKTDAEARIRAERIIKWCMRARKNYYSVQFQFLERMIKTSKSRLENITINSTENNIENIYCGDSKHISSSESYYFDTSYNFDYESENLEQKTILLKKRNSKNEKNEISNKVQEQKKVSSEPFVINLQGQVVNILPTDTSEKGVESWSCNATCTIMKDKKIFDDYKSFLEILVSQTLSSVPKFLQQCFVTHSEDKLGHSYSCYSDKSKCQSISFCLHLLAPHFPLVRSLLRYLYKLNEYYKKLLKLSYDLETANIKSLMEIEQEMKKKNREFNVNNTMDCLDEDTIIAENSAAFKSYSKKMMDLPRYHCRSCQRLLFERNLKNIDSFQFPIVNPYWDQMENYFINHHEINSKFICDNCLKYFRKGDMPATCILNNFDDDDVPIEVKELNSYEVILIQQAKAFQVVQRAGTVQNKNMPHSSRYNKAKGQCFYLPLPLPETLEKLASEFDPINKNHELYIMVRSLPTKAKYVWENLVNLKKVFKALQWLQLNNILYKDIILPKSAEGLMQYLENNDIEFLVESNDKEINESDEKQMSIQCSQSDDEDLGANISGPVPNPAEDHNNNNEIHENDRLERRAILTQVDHSELDYEQFTIYPLYDKRINKTATDIYQMLKIQEEPLDSRLKTLDLKCFPNLYPRGINGQHEDRAKKVRDHDFIKQKLCSVKPRFRLDHQYIFFLLQNDTIRRLKAGIYHMLNVTNPRDKYTVRNYLNKLSEGQLEGELTSILERLPNTEEFWKKPRNNLKCMIREYGPATWFLTLSPAEYMCEDLVLYVREINSPFLNNMSPGQVIAADPVSVSRYMDQKFRAMLDFLNSDSHPIGKISHFFWRREYQGRGIQHFHTLIWVENAPIIEKDEIEKIVMFIQQYITCKMPNKNSSPTLYRRVTTHQTHYHNSYCMRSSKNKYGKITKRCRFGFPRPVTDTFVLRDPAIAIANHRQSRSKDKLYDLPRTEDEKNINDYNPAIVAVWEGNMDIQFVGERTSTIITYITKYITKHERSKTQAMVNDINSTTPLLKRLWNFAFQSLNNREIGALEAADTLLGVSLSGTDNNTTIRWLNVRQIRGRKVKTYEEIKKMEDESTDIFAPSLIDDHYPSRPAELENLCLYEFAKEWDVVKSEPISDKVEYYILKKNDEGNPMLWVKKRSRGYLINHYMYNIKSQPEEFYFSLLFLFNPWRNTDELKTGFETFADSFNAKRGQLQKACDYFQRQEEFQKGLDYMQQLIEENEKNIIENKDQQDEPGDLIIDDNDKKAVDEAMKDFIDIDNAAANEEVDLKDLISQLNTDQLRVFHRVTASLTNHEDEPLRIYVSGEGGTGKSFLIYVIKTWIRKTLNRPIAIAAPTGLAAFGINGMTLHRIFSLPVQHGGTPKYKILSDAALKVLREQLADIALVIIDEISMVSNVTLMYINRRLNEIFNTSDEVNGWFGKKHVLFFGDLLQLMPVAQDASYMDLSSNDMKKCLESMGSINIWKHLVEYEELTINMRQRNDEAYGKLLSRLRLGAMTKEDVQLLTTRNINLDSFLAGNRLDALCDYIQKLPQSTVCLLPTNEMCDSINSAMLDRIKSSETINLSANDIIDCKLIYKKKAEKDLLKNEHDASRSAGLAKNITIKIGSKIMIRRNIDYTLGLVNGALGTVLSVSKSNDGKTLQSIVVKLTKGDRECVVERIDVKFQLSDEVYVIRSQFPICLSYAMTIHKSQGVSLECAIIDVGERCFAKGMTYVALSRVTTLSGLHLINFDPSKAIASQTAIEEYNRLRKIYKPDLKEIPITFRSLPKNLDAKWCFKQFFQDTECEKKLRILDTLSNVHGLSNNDGSSSYVNSVMQCILHIKVLHESFEKIRNLDDSEVAKFFHAYTSGTTSSVDEIKKFVGKALCHNMEDDPAKFLAALCKKDLVLTEHLGHEQKYLEKCGSCSYVNVSLSNQSVINLLIPNKNKIFTLQELINQSLSLWHEGMGTCVDCFSSTKILRKLEILKSNNVIALKVNSLSMNQNGQLRNNNFSIKGIPTTKVDICSSIYKVTCAIFKDGGTSNKHFVSYIRNKTSWIKINDLIVTNESWPRNANNAYIFFLERTHNETKRIKRIL